MSRKVASSLILALVITTTIPYGIAPAAAQGGAPGGDVLLSTFEYDDTAPAVAYNSNAQEFLVVWRHPKGNIYGQRYDWQGVPQGENFAISTAPHDKYEPAVAYSFSADSYLVVWEGYNGNDYDIYGQLVDADGTLLDNPSTLEDETDPTVNFSIYFGVGDQRHVDLDFDGNSYLVVWQSDEDGSLDIYARFVQDDGTVELAVFPIATTGAVPRQEPAVAYNSTENEYLVVFLYDEDADAEIHARRVDPAGLLPGTEYPIADQHRACHPQVAAAGWGAYVVVWSDYREPGESNIYGQVVLAGADNSFDGGDFPICMANANQFYPVIARSPSTGQFLVVWDDARQDTDSGWDIYAQRLLADANLVGDNFAINTAGGDQTYPAIAASQTPDVYFVAWEDSRTGADDVYGQRVAWTGSLLWYEFAISAQPEAQSSPAVAYNGDDDQYLAVWEDYREGYYAIYGQRLSADGQPLEEPWAIEDDGHDNVEPDVAYNSQRGLYLVVWADTSLDQIEGRQVYPGGEATVWFPVSDSDGGRRPRLAYDEPDDHFLAVWEAGGDVYAHALQGDGLSIGVNSTVVAGGGGQEEYPAVAFDSDNQRFFVVWDDDLSGDERIYGRLVDDSGGTVGAAFPVAGGVDGLPRYRPALAYNSDSGEYLVVYECQVASKETDVYGQRVSNLGSPTGSEIVIRDQPANAEQFAPDVVYVPEATRYYVIWSEDQGGTNDHDLYGRWLEADGSMATGALPSFRYPGDQKYPRLAYDPDHEQGLGVWMDTRRSKGGDVYSRLGALDTTPPTACFTRDPTVGLPGTTFTFNAWPSSDDLTPCGALAVRWDWTSNGSWDTDWSLGKVVTQTVILPNVYTVTLQVRDLMSQTDTISLPVWVLSPGANTPPTATLTISPVFGTADSIFTLDGSGCTDAETPAANLQVRWDWENDGVFDTLWSGLKTRTRSYTDAGLHTVRVEVRDEEGLTDGASRNLLVWPSTVVTLEVSPAAARTVPGETVQFRATAWDTYDNEMSNPSVVWSVTDPLAGIIDSSGVFTASTRAGTYSDVILAESEGVTDTASVTIVWPYQIYLPLVLRNF